MQTKRKERNYLYEYFIVPATGNAMARLGNIINYGKVQTSEPQLRSPTLPTCHANFLILTSQMLFFMKFIN